MSTMAGLVQLLPAARTKHEPGMLDVFPGFPSPQTLPSCVEPRQLVEISSFDDLAAPHRQLLL